MIIKYKYFEYNKYTFFPIKDILFQKSSELFLQYCYWLTIFLLAPQQSFSSIKNNKRDNCWIHVASIFVMPYASNA